MVLFKKIWAQKPLFYKFWAQKLVILEIFRYFYAQKSGNFSHCARIRNAITICFIKLHLFLEEDEHGH